MKLIKKSSELKLSKLKDLMNVVDGTCSFKEKAEAKKIFKIYLNESKIIK